MSIQVTGLNFSYDSRPVLSDVSFTAREGSLLSVLGPNGVGKSTLFRCILGLLTNYSGSIEIEGADIKTMGAKKLAELAAYIPQSNYPSFNYSVMDMVLMGTTVQVGSLSSPGAEQIELCKAALDRMGIYHLKDRGYTKISGGEKQLTLIARALVQQARTLIMDEPTANLDFGNQIRVLEQIRSLAREGYTVVQSTHNPDQTFMFSDEVLALKGGHVIANGTPAEVVTAELMRELYSVDIEVQSLYNDRFRVCVPKAITSET